MFQENRGSSFQNNAEREKGLEKESILSQFRGQDMEVTVGRNPDKNHSKPWKDGGWVVSGFKDKEPDNLVVVKSVIRDGERVNLEKVYEPDEIEGLLKSQPFQEGAAVPIINDAGEVESQNWGSKDTRKWSIYKKMGKGVYVVEGIKKGEPNETKMLKKTDLINAKITELKFRRDGITMFDDITASDRETLQEIDKEVLFWKEKLSVTQACEFIG